MYKKGSAWSDEYIILNKFARMKREPADYGSKRVLFTERRRTLANRSISGEHYPDDPDKLADCRRFVPPLWA